MDRFHERLSSIIDPYDTSTDHQQITIGSGSGGIDMRLMKNLKESIYQVSAGDDPSRILLYNFTRTITLRALTNQGGLDVEIIRWRPRYDTDETPVQVFAFASSSGTDYKKPALTTLGATLFDSRVWVCAYKAVKKYNRVVKPNKALKMTFKRTFKQPKVIDYLGEFYYTLASRPTGAFSDYQFQQKAKLSEVITYRIKGMDPYADSGGGAAPHAIATNNPGLWITDESEFHYLRSVTTNITKASYESYFSRTPVTLTSTSMNTILPDGSITQPWSLVQKAPI